MHLTKTITYRIFIIIVLCISIFFIYSNTNYVYSVSDYEGSFSKNKTYTSLVETNYYNFYTESDLTYDKVYDPITCCVNIDLRNNYTNLITKYQEDYYNTYSIIRNNNLSTDELTKYNDELDKILDELYQTKELLSKLDEQSKQVFYEEYQTWVNSYTCKINESKTVTLNEEQTLKYSLHIPYNYNVNVSYPVLVVVGNDKNGFDDFNGFYSSWYSQIKYNNLSQYDCFIIHINPSNDFFTGYDNGIGINSLSCSGEDGCYKLTSDITYDFIYQATYSNVYNAHIIDFAPEEQLLCNLIDDLAGKYNINAEKQYIMGYEFGATFASDLISKNPERFAAGVIICPQTCDISEQNCQALTNTNLWFVNYDENDVCNRYLCSLMAEEINDCKAKYNSGFNYTVCYSNLVDNEINKFLKGTTAIAKEGVSVTESFQLLNFLFNSTKVKNTTYLNEIDYLWSDDYQTCSAIKYYLENEIKHSYSITTNTTFVIDQEATCEGNILGHYEAYFSEEDKTSLNIVDQCLEPCSIEIPDTAIGHKYANAHYLLNDDHTYCYAEMTCENDISHVITETVPVKYVKKTNATLTEDETGYYQGSFGEPFGEYQSSIIKNETSRQILLIILFAIICVVIIIIVILINVKTRKKYDRKPVTFGKLRNKRKRTKRSKY